jgi:hypothetical protein
MKIVDRGVFSTPQAGTRRAIATFPSVTTLPDRSLIASYRVGTGKDSPDGNVELCSSFDEGRTWSGHTIPFSSVIGNRNGEIRCVYITPLSETHLLACALWSDRQTYPGMPLFNPETEGCLPMAILLADSYDRGKTWTPWRVAPMDEDIGPPSLTSPVLLLPDGRLAMSIETNKSYYDRSTWRQRVVYLFSEDRGVTWSAPVTVCEDPAARIFFWDQRAGVSPDGRLVTFSWVYDRQENTYLNILRRTSSDGGKTWSDPVDLGFGDQPSRPAILPDGRVILAWVDRHGTQTIRARLAADVEAPFLEETEVVLYSHKQPHAERAADTGEQLTEMNVWTYGLPFAEVLPGGDVIVAFYAGTDVTMAPNWCHLSVDPTQSTLATTPA